MKKYAFFCAAVCVAMSFTGCKSGETAYKQAYLRAQQQEQQRQEQAQQNAAAVAAQDEATVVTPLEERSTVSAPVVDNGDNVTVQQEQVSVVHGGGLKNFSVVVGSFSLKANAEALQSSLKQAGYDAQVAVNNSVTPPMYRVIATTFDDKAEAAASRNQLISKYPKAWLLYAK